MNISSDSAEKIASAISSVEAQNMAKNSEEFLADHIMQVVNNPKYMQSKNPIDLKNIGYEKINCIAGGETAGIPFAAYISERLSIPMIYVRKKTKTWGTLKKKRPNKNIGKIFIHKMIKNQPKQMKRIKQKVLHQLFQRQ